MRARRSSRGASSRACGRVAHYPAQDVLLVDVGARGAMVPLVSAFVRAIDVAAKRIVVDLPDGLLDAREADEA